MVRGLGYIKTVEDIENISVGTYRSIPIRLKDVAHVQMGGELRLGIIEENGEGEAVGGIVVMRYGQNAKDVIESVKTRIKEFEKGLPQGVTFHIAYDRSGLINDSIATLTRRRGKLLAVQNLSSIPGIKCICYLQKFRMEQERNFPSSNRNPKEYFIK